MKKLLSILLICTMMFCLAACGKDKEEKEEGIKEADFVGTWESTYDWFSEEDNKDINYTVTLELDSKGGGVYKVYSNTHNEEQLLLLVDWVLDKETETIKVTHEKEYSSILLYFEYDKENNTLTNRDVENAIFKKQ